MQWLRALNSILLLSFLNITQPNCGGFQRCTKRGSWVIHVTASNYSQRSYATPNTDKIQWPLIDQAQNMLQRMGCKHWPKSKIYLFKLAWATPYRQQQQSSTHEQAATLNAAQFVSRILQFPITLLFQPCLPCHCQPIKQLTSKVPISKTNTWVPGHIYAIHNIRVLQTACTEVNYTSPFKCKAISINKAEKQKNYCVLPISNYSCISSSLVNTMLTFTFLFLCRLQSYCNNLQWLIIINTYLIIVLFLLPWKYLLILYLGGKKFNQYFKLRLQGIDPSYLGLKNSWSH